MTKKFKAILGLFFCFVSVTAQVDLQDSLVAYYPFSGNADDASGNENHGRVDGPVLTSDRHDEENSAYEFNGVDDIITVLDDSTLHLNEVFTLVAWVMPYNTKDHIIFRKGSSQNLPPSRGAYDLSLAANNHFTFTLGTDKGPDGLSSQLGLINQPYEPNVWYRVILQKNDETIRLTTNEFGRDRFNYYEKSVVGSILHDTSPLVIGTRTRQAANTFEGKIDDIKIYNRFVSLEEITGLSFDDMTTSTDEIWKDEISFSPNPFSSEISVEVPNLKSSDGIRLTVFDLLGNLVLDQLLTDEKTIFKTLNIPPGMYMIRLSDSTTNFSRLIVRI